MKFTTKELDKLVGGAIKPDRVVMKSVDPSPEYEMRMSTRRYEDDIAFHNLLRNKAQLQYVDLDQRLPGPVAALNDYRPRNQTAFFQYVPHHNMFPEHELVNRVEQLYSGKGARHDHPKLHQLFLDSFSSHPELITMYNR